MAASLLVVFGFVVEAKLERRILVLKHIGEGIYFSKLSPPPPISLLLLLGLSTKSPASSTQRGMETGKKGT